MGPDNAKSQALPRSGAPTRRPVKGAWSDGDEPFLLMAAICRDEEDVEVVWVVAGVSGERYPFPIGGPLRGLIDTGVIGELAWLAPTRRTDPYIATPAPRRFEDDSVALG